MSECVCVWIILSQVWFYLKGVCLSILFTSLQLSKVYCQTVHCLLVVLPNCPLSSGCTARLSTVFWLHCQTVHCLLVVLPNCPLSSGCTAKLSTVFWGVLPNCPLSSGCTARLSTVFWGVLPNCPLSSEVYCQFFHQLFSACCQIVHSYLMYAAKLFLIHG